MPSRYRTHHNQAPGAGFVLVVAIFLLVVLSAMAAFMLHVSTASQSASILDLQGSRAFQAARVGIERGLWGVLQNGNSCPASTQTIALSGTLNGFVVSWNCSSTSFTESSLSTSSTARTLYQITSTARFGSAGSVDYVERQLVALTETEQ